MKIGETTDSIYATSFKVKPGFKGAPYPFEEQVVVLEAIDGTVFDSIDYGNRKEQTADFSLDHMSQAEYKALLDYLLPKAGTSVRFQIENAAERVFGDTVTTSPLYAYIVKVDPKGEREFSMTRRLWSIDLQIAFAGTTSTSKPATNDASEFDILLEIDTVQANFVQSGTPTATATDQRWFDTDDNKLYQWDGVTWQLLYTVAADNAAYGFKRGIFYLSAFGDLTSASDGIPVGRTYKSGLINRRSVTMAGFSVDIKNGPTIARRDGFKFALDNADLLWAWVITNSVAVFGSRVSKKIYDRGNAEIVSQASGINNNNSFDYTNYQFEVEPVLLNEKSIVPPGTVNSDDARYSRIKPEQVGKPIIRTYGQHEYAKMQEVSKIDETMGVFNEATDHDEFVMTGVIFNSPSRKQLKIRRTNPGGGGSYFILTSDQEALLNAGDYTVTVLSDSDVLTAAANKKILRRILSVTLITNYAMLELEDDFPSLSTGTLIVSIQSHSFKWQIDDQLCEGFGGLEVFKVGNGKGSMVRVPVSGFEVNDDENMITLHPGLYGGDTEIKQYTRGTALESHFRPSDERAMAGYPGITENQRTKTEFNLTAYDYWDEDYKYPYNMGWSASNVLGWGAGFSSFRAYVNPIGPPRYITGELGATSADGKANAEVAVVSMAYKVDHSSDSSSGLLDITDVKMVVDFNIFCKNLWYHRYVWTAHLPTALKRTDGGRFRFRMRVRFADGSFYVPAATWDYSFDYTNMGVNNNNADATENSIYISNMPDGSRVGRFSPGSPSLATLYNYRIERVFATEALMNASTGNEWGDLCYIDHATVANRKIFTFDYTTDAWVQVSLYSSLAADCKVFLRNNTGNAVFVKDAAGTGMNGWTVVVNSSSGTDELRQVFGSRDMFDISELFVAGLWELVDQIEFDVINLDQNNQRSPHNSLTGWSQNWSILIDQVTPPQIYWNQSVSFVGEQLYATVVGGRHLRSTESTTVTYRERPMDITYDIFQTAFPNRFVRSSLTELGYKANRNNWAWRKQYIEGEDSMLVLEDLMWNAWAVAFIDEDDQINLKSLSIGDYSPVQTFTDANIVRGSISSPIFRKADEIYQRFVLKSKWNPGLERHAVETVLDYQTGDAESLERCKLSKYVFNLNNQMVKEFNCFGDGVPFASELVKFFTGNSWTFRIKSSMRDIIYSSSLMTGVTRIRLMDVVSVNSFFMTNGVAILAFVVGLKPDFYNGTVEYTLYVPDPPGKLAWASDPWKDALFDYRDNAIMTFNDAGNTSRNTGLVVFDDAQR